MPRLSIGLPVYNGENYLEEAIECLLGQTYADFELIISDNASSDGTGEICRRYADRDPRVRYVRQETNRGAGWNFSETFRLARGEYFKWAAHDDLCAPTFLAACVARLDADPGLVLCSARSAVIDDEGRLIEADMPDDPHLPDFQGVSAATEVQRLRRLASPRPSERYLGVLVYSLRCYEIFGVVRSAAMRRTGLHRPYNGAEKVLLAELSLQGRFAEIDEVLFYSRWHGARFSSNGSAIEQALHMNPTAARRFAWPRQLHCAWGYLAAIATARLAARERAASLLAWGRWLAQVSKWRRVAGEALTGRGTTVYLPESARRSERPDSAALVS
jgi:glycosyltransferase involved in cell wall biosynthesis